MRKVEYVTEFASCTRCPVHTSLAMATKLRVNGHAVCFDCMTSDEQESPIIPSRVRRGHVNMDVYLCRWCDFGADSLNTLFDHARQAHPKQYALETKRPNIGYTNAPETLPIDQIIAQCEYDAHEARKQLEQLLPKDFHYLIDRLYNSAWSVGGLRVVAKAGDQAQIVLEGRIK